MKQHIPFHELHKTFFCRCYPNIRYIFHKLQHPFMQQFMNHFIAHSVCRIHCMVLHPFTMISIQMPFSRSINIYSNQLKVVSLIPNRKNHSHQIFNTIPFTSYMYYFFGSSITICSNTSNLSIHIIIVIESFCIRSFSG